MRNCLVGLLILTGAGTTGDATVPGQCISGCNIPNPQQQQQSQAGLARVFHFQAIQNSQDFWLREATRRERLPAISRLNLPIRDQSSLITGPAGNARFTLVDGTTVSLAPATELVIDRFEISNNGSAKLSMHLAKGKMRWANRVLEPILNRIFPQPRIGRHPCATRGTDFELSQDVDGSGFVRVYKGTFIFNDHDTGAVLEVHPGQRLTFQNFKVVGVQ